MNNVTALEEAQHRTCSPIYNSSIWQDQLQNDSSYFNMDKRYCVHSISWEAPLGKRRKESYVILKDRWKYL